MSTMTTAASVPLSFVPPGGRVRLIEIGNAIAAGQREQLAAYGLVPACLLTVLQQRPMTVILGNELELALEHVVSRDIWVEALGEQP